MSSVFALSTASGCAHAESAEAAQLAEMGESITRMQVDRDREDARYGSLGVKMAEEQGAADKETETPANSSARAPLVPLRPTSLGQSDEPLESDDPDDTTPRPEIRIVGTPSTARVVRTKAPSYPGVRKNSPKGPKEIR